MWISSYFFKPFLTSQKCFPLLICLDHYVHYAYTRISHQKDLGYLHLDSPDISHVIGNA